ncbi:MAG TPA: alpha/beta hydrolase [Oligoflexia bacterium]|nr:alpha/beta hydrolase [Oligoflexia bacterium]HMR25117.1 alpha/beta hydrolase [Oligoflexia bacterium]
MHSWQLELYNKPVFRLSGLKTKNNAPEIVCLHGWLDNAMSFQPLMQAFPEYSIHALDLPGHGQSDHLPNMIPAYSMAQVAFILNDYLKTLNTPIVLMAHSLGAGLASLVAALFPQQIKALVLLDNVIPIPNDDLAMTPLKKLALVKSKPANTYASFDKAVEARCKYGVSKDIAHLLAQRSVSENEQGTFYWHHDPRLLYPSLGYFSTPDVHDIVTQVQQPVLYFYGDWDYRYEDRMRAANSIQNIHMVKVSGDHYFHMRTPQLLRDIIKSFLANNI